MAGVRYTIEQLFTLKDSPLVHKPDALPSIEQWLEYVAQPLPILLENKLIDHYL